MSWVSSVVALTIFTSMFPGTGFVWGLCFSLIMLVICWEMLSVSLFFTLINSWVLLDYVCLLMEVLVAVVFMISMSCSVKDYSVCNGESFKGMDFVLMLVSFFCFLFFIEGGWMGFYFFFEATLIPTLWLILKWGYQPERLQAGMFMLLYTAGASVPLLVALVYMEEICQSDSFILAKMSCSPLLKVPIWVWGFSLFGFLVKVPIYGFHVWLPKAHVEAPLSGSMVLAGVLLKLGGFGLIRLMWALSMYMNNFFLFVVGFSLWGGFFTSLVAMVQCDIKSIIAYSSIGHMSMAVGGLMSCYPMGKLSAECMMFAHGICSPCMFALAASSYDWSHSRNVSLNKSVLQVFPMFCFFWFVFSVINMGCPPSLNYFAEVISFSAIKDLSLVLILPMGLMCQFTCVYVVFLYGYVNHGSVSSLIRSKGLLSERYLSSFMVSGLVLLLGFFVLDFFL